MSNRYFKLLLFSILSISLQNVTASSPLNKTTNSTYKLHEGITKSDYQAGTLIFRLRAEYRHDARKSSIDNVTVNEILDKVGASNIRKVFPGKTAPLTEKNAAGMPLTDLSLIYTVKFDTGIPIEKAINTMLNSGMFEYVEPRFIPRLLYNPNDPSTGSQYYLTNIQAYAGWDISTGDTTVIIGITDTGTDTDHPDLAANIKHNYADPINGIDDDGDGYTDNFTGWDLGENDNDPQVNASLHGSHVSGCAAAVTDNGVGVASPGFNCKFLPVKIANAQGSLTEAYEGIVYTADHGCQIINCSWGGPGGGSFGQNVIDYATNNMNALVIAAAGNDGVETSFFPASYKNVLSVASTNSSDAKSSFSNYGSTVDVCAPGSFIYSTYFNDTYTYSNGTSMASPIAAGCAAIIKSMNPTFNALQIGEQLRVTCDDIYSSGGNFLFQDKLGTGRVNLFRALTENGPSVRYTDLIFSDGNDNTFVIGDTISITGIITNYLSPTTSLDITMLSTSPNISIIDNYHSVGALGTMASTDNNADPFSFSINPGTPQNSKIYLKMYITDVVTNYTDFQLVEITVNVDYINVTQNQVSTTITSKGRICYNSESQQQGLGFQYSGENLVYEAGLMIGSSGTQVSDNVRGASGTDNDFLSSVVVQKVVPTVLSDFDLTGWFNDNIATGPLPVNVHHNAYAWSNPGDDKYVIVEYFIHNSGASPLNTVYAGIFADWDIMDYSLNRAEENASLKMGYIFSTQTNGLYAGIKVLTPTPFVHYAIDNVAGQGGINMTDGYSTSEKYVTLSTNRSAAGQNNNGNDVIDVVSTGPFNILPGDSVLVAFALIAGDDLTDLNISAANAQTKYDLVTGLESSVISELGNLYPNPATNIIHIPLESNQIQSVLITDVLGRTVKIVDLKAGNNALLELNVDDLNNGMYIVTITGSAQRTYKFTKQ
jgi:serine protease